MAPDSIRPVRVRRGLTLEDVTKVEERKLELPGVIVEVEPQRTYPTSTFAAHLLGYVREVSDEQARALRAGAEVTLSFPRREGAGLQGTLTSARRTGRRQWSLGLKYHDASEADERLAVELAFGASTQLVENNRRRHAGRSTLGGLGYLGQYAFTHGWGHLAFLASRQWARAMRRT